MHKYRNKHWNNIEAQKSFRTIYTITFYHCVYRGRYRCWLTKCEHIQKRANFWSPLTVSSLLHLLLNYLWLIKKNTVPLSSNSGFGNCPLCLLSSKRIFIIWFSGCIPSLLEKFLPSLLPNVKPAKQSLTWAPERDNYSDQIYPENIHWQDFLINLLTDICILKAFFTHLNWYSGLRAHI